MVFEFLAGAHMKELHPDGYQNEQRLPSGRIIGALKRPQTQITNGLKLLNLNQNLVPGRGLEPVL